MNKTDIINKLIQSNITISFAESMTGGALASALTKVKGVSSIFKGSFVVYSKEYKMKYLNVKEETIDKYGIVSIEVAREMADSLQEITSAKLAISVTGNAGPTTNDNLSNVGKVCIGIAYKGLIKTIELNIHKSREEIINETVDYVYEEIERLL